MLVCVCTREDIESICGASSKAHLLAFRHEQTIAKQAPSNALVPKSTHKHTLDQRKHTCTGGLLQIRHGAAPTATIETRDQSIP